MTHHAPFKRAFSMVEMLIALAISAMVLAASLAALDALFKSYQSTSEQASTHIVARMTMHRVMTMIRTGTQFAPYPADVLDDAQNPLVDQDAIEFVSWNDPVTGDYAITRLERRVAAPYTVGESTYELRGPFVLWVEIHNYAGGAEMVDEQPLLDGIENVTFTLEYEVGPRLRRATMDLSVRTGSDTTYTFDEDGDATVETNINLMSEAPPVRMVASVSPRRLD